MALRIVATNPDPSLVTLLPWDTPLEEWTGSFMVPLPRGISRHIVRFVRLGTHVYAVKETREPIAFGEYRLLRDLRRLKAPAVEPVGVVTGRQTRTGGTIEPCLVTRHLGSSMPYREMFSRGVRVDTLPRLVDALVVLLTRLHLAGFFWGDCSLSNTLFRRSAGEFAAYLVDAETGELHPDLSDGQRAYDLDTAKGNLFGEMLDLQAGGFMDPELDPIPIVEGLLERYDSLWSELTGVEDFTTDEMWRIQMRIERLNDLGFDVDAAAAERPRRVRRGQRAPERGAGAGGAPLAHRGVRAGHPDGTAGQALPRRGRRDLPRDPRAPLVPVRAGGRGGGHVRGGAGLLPQGAQGRASRSRLRAMTSRWIWFVPSKICVTFASRM
jgi:uncharacterized protein DUF4032/lipopolysaccharide kinase (Kdo/WaaP) family protein